MQGIRKTANNSAFRLWRSVRALATALLLAALASTSALAQSFSGTYILPLGSSEARLTLHPEKDGKVAGTLVGPAGGFAFAGRILQGRVVGTIPSKEGNLLFNVIPQDGRMIFRYMKTDSDGKAIAETVKEIVFPASSSAAGSSASPDRQRVCVNGVDLEEAQRVRLERQCGHRIPAGDYWYDRRCGAWGLQGGPTLGLTVAGLKVGGPLRADASNGHTGVFVNGRELHIVDVLGLQRAGVQVLRGRWWVNANGDFGQEGGWLPLGNLVRIARQAGGKSYGNHYSEAAGGSVASDGQGGFIASFRDGHGGYIGQNSGQ